jgi:hypothetical protein
MDEIVINPSKGQKGSDGTGKQGYQLGLGFNPYNTTRTSIFNVEDADEDKLNPYHDELRFDEDEDEKLKSTWMISGRNRQI